MAWTDPATDSQISARFRMFRYTHSASLAEEDNRYNWIKEHRPTRKEMSQELGRVRKLKIDRNCNEKTAWDSDVWADYNSK